jgi:hypothetical protein
MSARCKICMKHPILSEISIYCHLFALSKNCQQIFSDHYKKNCVLWIFKNVTVTFSGGICWLILPFLGGFEIYDHASIRCLNLLFLVLLIFCVLVILLFHSNLCVLYFYVPIHCFKMNFSCEWQLKSADPSDGHKLRGLSHIVFVLSRIL